MRPMRTLINKLRRKLGDSTATRPTYIFTESRVGFRMPRGERGGGGGEARATP